MDWTPKQNLAKKLINKFGASMSLITAVPSAYDATTDSMTATLTTYEVKAVIINPTMVSPQGIYGKSDKTRLLLQGKDLPDLSSIDFKIDYDGIVLIPETITAIKPGGTTIMYAIDVK